MLAPHGRIVVAVCGPASHARSYGALAAILRREVGAEAAAMVDGYFALGEAAELQRLCTTAGIAGAHVQIREDWARFASIDELARIEIKGSPLASLVDETRYRNVLKAARQELRDFSDAESRVRLRLDATIADAKKG